MPKGSKNTAQRRPTRRQSPESDEDIEKLATELYASVRLHLKAFGVTPDVDARALRRSRSLSAAPRASGRLLQESYGLSTLLLEWSQNPRFLDVEGKPRVLPMYGEGETFEALAKRHLPSKSVAAVVKLACSRADVAKHPNRRVALLGAIMVDVTRTRQTLLASAVRHVTQILKTVLLTTKPHDKPGPHKSGHIFRVVMGIVERDRFLALQEELRPQLHDLIQRVDTAMHHRRPQSVKALQESTAMAVGLYVSTEDDLVRAGIDPQTLLADLPPRPGRRTRASRS